MPIKFFDPSTCTDKNLRQLEEDFSIFESKVDRIHKIYTLMGHGPLSNQPFVLLWCHYSDRTEKAKRRLASSQATEQ